MFDFGFSEVLLTSVIALIVLGPEKLPRAASQVGRWVGRARAMARQFREQLEEEVNLENVKKAHKEEETKKAAEAKQGGGAEGAAGVNPAAASPGSTSGPDMNPTRAAATGQDSVAGQAADASGASAGQDAAAYGATSGQPATAEDISHAERPYTQPASSAEAPFSSQISPDPADFRADTFSHAHPTDDFGANPLTANGAPEPAPQLAAGEAAREFRAQPSDDTAGAANASAPTSSPPHEPSGFAPHRPEVSEAYASATATVPAQVPPPASETATDAHSTTPPEKSGPA